MYGIFFDEKGGVRSGWRAAVFLLSFLFLSFFLILGSIALVSQIPMGESAGSYIPLVLPFTVSSLLAIVLGWLFGKLFEKLPFNALGISFSGHSLKNFAVGCLVGAVGLGSSILVALMSGGISLTINRESSARAIMTTLLSTLLIFVVGALSEETLFRGYLLQTLVRSKQIWIGFAITSLLFATAHNGNPDASSLSWLNTFLAGIWFAAAYMKTRDIWFPLGIHLIWNWLQGPVFGINVSGIAEFSPDPVLRATDAGPVWLTGGSYGIEGGIACTIGLMISIGHVYYLPNLKPSVPPAVAGG